MADLNRLVVSVFVVFCMTSPAIAADMQAKLLKPWDGKSVPAGQQCKKFGGNGSTPPMIVSNLPAGTDWVLVEYNDKSYTPLSTRGGHGSIGYLVKGSSANLPAVPGMTDKLPKGVKVVAKARSTGAYASKGYLPPCSGGRGNRYVAVVKAMSAKGKVLAKKTVEMGRY